MFSEERRQTIFGNIEHLYEFQSGFLKRLESAVNWEQPHLSEIGCVFVEHRQDFKIYSEYCNNHPLAVSELQEVYADPKYVQFFEVRVITIQHFRRLCSPLARRVQSPTDPSSPFLRRHAGCCRT